MQIKPCIGGENIGLLTDAGCPNIADPGAKLILHAHENNINVIPLVGPSSILLAMMSSGLNGNNFSFNGYLPIDKNERSKKIKKLEIHSKNYKNIYLIGFSQGAMLSYLVGLTNNFVSGICCLSGWVDTRFSNFTNKTSNIYASHGKNDTVIPYDIARKSVDLLSNSGFNINFNSFDSEHGVNQKNLDSLISWLNNLNT